MKGPFFIVCANSRCKAVKRVPSRYKQKLQQFCSRRCVGIVLGPVGTLTLVQRRAAAEKSKKVRQAQAMRRLAGMSKIDVFRMAYSTGWKAGARSARRRLTITPTPGARS